MKPDRISGATTVADKVIGRLHEWLTKSKSRSHNVFLSGLEKECLKFLADYPAMGNICGLINAVGLSLDCAPRKSRKTSDIADKIAFQIKRWKENESRALRTIPRLAAHTIGPEKTILTLSSSELVKQTFLALKPKKVKAIVLESRPLREGERTAFGLAQAGVPTTLIIDIAFPSLEKEVDAVLIGADRMSKTLVNKVGSRVVLEWARLKKKPVFVVCQSSKLIPSSWCLQPLPDASSGEVSRLKHRGLAVHNFYFEECPLDLVNTVITEKGAAEGQSIRKKSAAVEASDWFRLLLEKLKTEERGH